MKTVSPELAAHLAGAALTLATCWKIERRDGAILGFTSHDRDLVFDLADGGGPAGPPAGKRDSSNCRGRARRR